MFFFFRLSEILKLRNFKSRLTYLLKETRNSLKIRALEFEKERQLNSNKQFIVLKTNERTCDISFTLLICFGWSVASFLGVIKHIFLVLMFFDACNKGITTKLADKMSREHPVGQPFCNAHTDLVWLYLNLILLFYLV